MSAVIDLLTRQHQEVLARIERQQDQFGGAGIAGGFLDFLERDVVTHFRLEEEVLFSACAASTASQRAELRPCLVIEP